MYKPCGVNTIIYTKHEEGGEDVSTTNVVGSGIIEEDTGNSVEEVNEILGRAPDLVNEPLLGW